MGRLVKRRILVAALLALCFGAFGCRRDADTSGSGSPSAGASSSRASSSRGLPELDLPELGRITEFSLVDQGGRAVTRETFTGKVWAAAFMFTRCPTVCPEITRRMRSVQVRAQKNGLPLTLVSFSVDPDNDTPEVLAKYAGEYGAALESWTFLTGKYEVVARTAEQGFKVALERRPDSKEHGGITHGSHLVLVDRQGSIRGYYRTSDDAALEQLLSDAARLAEP
jgi:protein SCO1/2